jgi:hypothetical protein
MDEIPCRKCDHVNASDALYCEVCGSPLGKPAEAGKMSTGARKVNVLAPDGNGTISNTGDNVRITQTNIQNQTVFVYEKREKGKISLNPMALAGDIALIEDGIGIQPVQKPAPADGQVLAQDGEDYERKVFVSYAWGDESERMVELLEEAFSQRGIRITRDKKDIHYRGSIETFENRLARGRCIILVISDNYLRSEHCMYELVKASEFQELRQRILPIVLKDAHFYKAIDRLEYIKYWEEEIKKLERNLRGVRQIVNVAGITANLDRYARIRSSFDQLTGLLGDMNTLTPEVHASTGFSTLIVAVERALGKKA